MILECLYAEFRAGINKYIRCTVRLPVLVGFGIALLDYVRAASQALVLFMRRRTAMTRAADYRHAVACSRPHQYHLHAFYYRYSIKLKQEENWAGTGRIFSD